MSADKKTRSHDEFLLQNVGFTLEEDEYGYVEPKGRRISEALIQELPSRKIDFNIPEDEKESTAYSASLRRRSSRYNTAKLKSATLSSHSADTDVDKICEVLNSDPDASEEDKIRTLRDMKRSLTIKRMVKDKLDAEYRRKRADQVLDHLTRLKLETLMAWHQFLYKIKGIYSIELWHSSIKTIQGQFGSGVASYFIFLRWLLYINLCTFCITLLFVVIPQFIYQQSDSAPETRYNFTEYTFSPYDLLTGSGWFSNSLFYFGHYTHEDINVVPGLYYSMPLAYLFTVGANFLITLIAVSYSLTTTYRKSYVGLAGEMKNIFCNKILCAWDYSVETEEAARLRKIAFCTEIKELLYMTKIESKEKTLAQNIVQIVSTVFVNIFVIAVTAAIGYLIYFLEDQKSLKVNIRILEDMTLSLTATLISVSCYFILKYSSKFEFYLSKKIKFYLTMGRVQVLRIVMLGIIVYFWTFTFNFDRNMNICYETELGKEIYRLILVNFFVAVVILTFFGEFIRKLVARYYPSVQLSHFDIAYNTLDLIYYQTLAWLGAVFIPLVSLMIIVILVLLFYIKLHSTASNCRPFKKFWSVHMGRLIFLELTFFMFLLSSLIVGYILFKLRPSDCGPFKEYEAITDLIQNIFTKKGEKYQTSEFIKYFTSPGVLFSIFCALGVGVYYMRAQAKAHVSVVKKVREQLMMEGKDKAFLLQLYDEAVKMHSYFVQNKDTSAKDDEITSLSNEGAHEVLINKAYKDYSYHPSGMPIPNKFGPGYIPANVPVNNPSCSSEMNSREISPKNVTPKVNPHLKSVLANPKERNSPLQKLKGIPYPVHRPAFEHLFQEEASL